jgi:hypothetical protein
MSMPQIGGKPANEVDPKIAVGVGPLQYKDVGTRIDCGAMATDDGRFQVNLTIEDSSVYLDGQAVQAAARSSEPPIFRSFRSSNELTLRDGQSLQFTAAADRISGEVITVDVRLNVVK